MAVKWLKTGQESAQAAAKEEAQREAYKSGLGKLYRFFLKDKEVAKITFVDGDLQDTPEGKFLLPPRWYEHTVKVNGQLENVVCPQQSDPQAGHECPLCAGGDRASLVAAFTIIDHRERPSKDQKKIYKDQKRLLVAKPLSMEILVKHAMKRGGLAGATFEVTRMGDNSAAIGSMFEFEEKNPIDQLKSLFVQEVEVDGKKTMQTYFLPADYEKEIEFLTPAEMLKRGFGNASPAFGAKPSAGAINPGGVKSGGMDYSKDL